MPYIIEITEATDKEMLKKLMAFLHIKSLVELKKHTLQQIIGMLHRKEETAQKELQAKRQEFLAKLSTMTQKEWEELIEKEEEQQLIEQIAQSKAPPVILAKTTDGTDETTSCFLTISPEEQEKTIQTIDQAYLATALGTTHQLIESKCYENIEELKKNEPNLTLSEFLQTSLNQNKILLEVRTLIFTPQHFTNFKSQKDIQELIKDKKIRLVEKPQEQFIYAQFLFFSQPTPSRTSKNTDEDNEYKYRQASKLHSFGCSRSI